ncbi:cyclodeaminase/cyclohydrolase family protein [Desulforhabdus sp. TSK]|uniref:cyclodeaminase/cyclohydrolase family protein n=1 Tax=Desulforhabdus sp. TSK TaxID=2925014 RepID=UPI001FC7FDB4|nr:cyclodeaminase/cyclohydrolase family protein [Desulforhabdus sp. TSK]GKT10005.1 methenyltetrahydrofolate cyclohydrolase [Desulforhabdus sp. TSK]
MIRMQEISVREYLRELASARPTPGGGSAAAFCGALGAALTAMVAGLTARGDRFSAVRPQMEETRRRADSLAELFLRLAQEDADCYLKVSAAWKLPQGTEAQKKTRDDALREAMKAATQVPLETLRAVEKLLRETVRALRDGNPHAQGDAAAAAALAHAAAIAAIQNIRINLAGIREASYVAGCEEESRSLMRKITALMSEANDGIPADIRAG